MTARRRRSRHATFSCCSDRLLHRLRNSERSRLVTVTAILAIGFFGSSASASPLTYDWQGNNGATGLFTLDSSLFNAADSSQHISQSNYSAFSFTIGGDTFGMGDVQTSSDVVFNSTVTPPEYLDGAGIAAINGTGDELIFFPDTIGVVYKVGGFFSSDGDFVLASGVPAPGAITLLAVGLGAFGVISRRVRKAGT